MQRVANGIWLKDHIYLIDYIRVFELSRLAFDHYKEVAESRWLKKRRAARVVRDYCFEMLLGLARLSATRRFFKTRSSKHLERALDLAGMKGPQVEKGADGKKQIEQVAAWIGARISQTPNQVMGTLEPHQLEDFRKAILVNLYQEVERQLYIAHGDPVKYLADVKRVVKELQAHSRTASEYKGDPKRLEHKQDPKRMFQ